MVLINRRCYNKLKGCLTHKAVSIVNVVTDPNNINSNNTGMTGSSMTVACEVCQNGYVLITDYC
jgi:hypothetical protein